uniref:Uncharacterized protein n=1 Tax=Hippocampus comes TaxID=109280 RepID=A0A3Q2XQ10_HIPCM
VTPFPIIDFLVAGFQLGFARAHVDQQVQITIQQLQGEVIGLQLPSGLLLFGPLRAAVAEEEEAAGLRGAEVEGDGARLLGDRVQGRHVLAAEHQVAVQGDFWVTLDGQAGELQLEVVVLVHHLEGVWEKMSSI